MRATECLGKTLSFAFVVLTVFFPFFFFESFILFGKISLPSSLCPPSWTATPVCAVALLECIYVPGPCNFVL